MKLLSREQIEKLSKSKSGDFLTTSFYLSTDKSKLNKKEIKLSLKNLVNDGKSRIDQMDINKEKKGSLNKDLDKINSFCSRELSSFSSPGLAIFSSSGQDFWQVFHLPDSPRNRIIFDQNPYVRFLSAILDEHHGICALTLDRREAKWYEIFMGEISLLESIVGEVPSRVKEGGWEGYESKRIERHIATHLHDYFKKASRATFEFFKKNNFDWLFLGCSDEYYSDFEPLLHPYLKKKLKGRIKAKPSDPPSRILKESLELEKKLKKKEEEEIIHRLISELEKGGLATSGLKETLRSLNRGEVQTLVITRSFSKQGRVCPKCHFLFVDELRCPSCRIKTDIAVDIIDEAVEAAIDKNCQVKHITGSSKLNRYGKIGALLRYKT
jgi:peptide subunit release factor 1 (eRF1)